MPLYIVPQGIDFVREHPEMFFRGGAPSPLPCIRQLVSVALVLGADDVVVERFADWWVVWSHFDWFVADVSPAEQVRQIIAVPELGQNEQRAEVVLVAFAQAVATRRGDAPWEMLSGSTELPSIVARSGSTTSGRALAFRFPLP